jgi:hypothetical protein
LKVRLLGLASPLEEEALSTELVSTNDKTDAVLTQGKRGGRSRCPTAKRRRGGPVRRVGSLKRTLSSGPESLAVSGPDSSRRYILRVRAVDSAGNLSRIEGVRFTVC